MFAKDAFGMWKEHHKVKYIVMFCAREEEESEDKKHHVNNHGCCMYVPIASDSLHYFADISETLQMHAKMNRNSCAQGYLATREIKSWVRHYRYQ